MAEILSRPVLVLGESSRATLAVVRSLGRRGLAVHLGISGKSAEVTASSKYVAKIIDLPSPSREKSAWVAGIKEASKKYGYALIVPTTEGTAVPLINGRAEIETLAPLAVPSSESFTRTADKRITMQLATELQIPTPKTTVVSTPEELSAALEHVSIPTVIKPVFSRIWQGDTEIGLGVRIAKSKENAAIAASDLLKFAPVLLQEYFDGVGVGQEFLCKDGEIVYAFQHDRVREYNGSGGSTYRVSAPLHPGMLEASKKLLKALQWSGVVMIEYRYRPKTDSFTLIEINGRFWGSLPLPVALGMDFPYGLYEQMVRGKATPITTYRSGVYARSMFEDVAQARRAGASLAQMIAEYTKAFARMISGGEHWDQFALDDPMPFFVLFGGALKKVFGPLFQKTRISFDRKRARRHLIQSFAASKNVLFLCYGNINRSAFAESYLRLKDPTRRAFSAGEYPEGGREASQQAKQKASKWGVDLKDHFSRVLSAQQVSDADIILVMDGRNMSFLKQRFPESSDKAFYLGLAGNGPLLIEDPYGFSDDVFETTFSRIVGAIDDLEACTRP